MKYKKYIIIILWLLVAIGIINNIFDLAILSTGYPMGYMLYSGIYSVHNTVSVCLTNVCKCIEAYIYPWEYYIRIYHWLYNAVVYKL